MIDKLAKVTDDKLRAIVYEKDIYNQVIEICREKQIIKCWSNSCFDELYRKHINNKFIEESKKGKPHIVMSETDISRQQLREQSNTAPIVKSDISISKQSNEGLVVKAENPYENNIKDNIEVIEKLVMSDIIQLLCDELSEKIQHGIDSENSDLEEYHKGGKPEDKGINKYVESSIVEIFTSICKKIDESEGGNGIISYASETISDKCVNIMIPSKIRDKLKSESSDGYKPRRAVINIDAKGCMANDKDSQHERFHCGPAQTSIRKIVCKERFGEEDKPKDWDHNKNGRWMRRGSSEINGKQKTHHIQNGSKIPNITCLTKVVWSCEENTSDYKIEGISGYIIPNGYRLPIINEPRSAPKTKGKNGENAGTIRFHIIHDLKLPKELHYNVSKQTSSSSESKTLDSIQS